MSNEKKALLDNVFEAIDAMDAGRFANYLTVDGLFRFGSAPAVKGRSSIRDAVGGFFETIAGLSHSVDKTILNEDTLICEGKVSYERHDGSTVILPFADILELKGELISDYRIYMDISPLYEH